MGLHRGHAAGLGRRKFVVVRDAANGVVDGFIVEGPTAGGHNAPPRGKLQLTEAGEPIYGERDKVDLDAFRGFGVPFWLAGGYGTPDGLRAARAAGASTMTAEVTARGAGGAPGRG